VIKCNSKMLLCVDSSTTAGSVALVSSSQVLAEIVVQIKKRSHSDCLLRYIQYLLDEAELTLHDIDGLVVVVGPGSFTGLRVGLATVQGLAQALALPIYAVSSLQTVAYANGPSCLPVQVLLDARKHEVYTARYCWDDMLPRLQGVERVISPANLAVEVTTRTIFVGNGVRVYHDIILDRLPELALLSCAFNEVPRAGAAGLLVVAQAQAATVVTPFDLRPVYVRLSDAELHKNSQRSIEPVP